jgi:hypothetical protein
MTRGGWKLGYAQAWAPASDGATIVTRRTAPNRIRFIVRMFEVMGFAGTYTGVRKGMIPTSLAGN